MTHRAERARSTAVYLLPLLAALSLYAVTLGYDLTFDDKAHMEPPGIGDTRTFRELWETPALFYRPVVTTTFWLETRNGIPLWVRHGVNVVLHGVISLLVVRLALGLGLARWVAGGVGLLFAVHPVHVEAVSGLVGRADLLAALWLLLALWVHERAIRSRVGIGAVLGAIALSFLAANSKESAWGLPLFALVLHSAWRRSPMRGWPLFAAYGLGIGAHLFLRFHALGAWLASPRGEIPVIDNPLVGLGGIDRLIGGLKIGGLNLQHLTFPTLLAPDYSGYQIDLSGGLADPRFWGGVVLVLGPIGIWIWSRIRNPGGRPALTVGAGWLWISAFMVMNLVYTIETVLADRLLYWPSVAWVLILGGIAASVLRDRGPARGRRNWVLPVVAAVMVTLGIGYTVRTARYLPIWKNNQTLFEAAVVLTPRVPRVWYNHGFELHYAGQIEEAVAAYRRARDLDPNTQEAWAHEAVALMQLGRWDEAQKPLEEALRLDPRDVISLINAGIYWLHEDSLGKAVDVLESAVAEDPTRSEAWFNLGLAEAGRGSAVEAERAFRRCLELDPQDDVAMARLADALFDQGRVVEAVATIDQAIAIRDTPEYREQRERYRTPDPE